MVAPFPVFDIEDWRSAQFILIYSQYGGSGLQLTYRDVQEMDVTDIQWFLKRLNETRAKEAEELAAKK